MSNNNQSKALNIALWIGQVLLAAMFLMTGMMKTFQPMEAIIEMAPWVANAPAVLVRFIGISELLGGIGLLLPAILRIQPQMTGYAALGLMVVMVLAIAFHASRGEFSAIGTNVFLGAIAGFVAWGRLKRLPIAAK